MNSGYDPKVPTGFTPKALFDQWVLKSIRRLQPRKSNTVTFRQNDKGITFFSSPPGGGGAPLLQGVVTSLFGTDYIGVTPYDSNAEQTTGTEVLVAKSFPSRMPGEEVIDSIPILYTYYTENVRIAASQGYTSEVHTVHTRYIQYTTPPTANTDIGQFLVAYLKVQGNPLMTASDLHHDGQGITYLEVQPCRYWALSADQTIP